MASSLRSSKVFEAQVEKGPHLVLGQHRDRLVGDVGGAHLRHRVDGDVLLFDHPAEVLLQGAEPVIGRRRRTCLKETTHEAVEMTPRHVRRPLNAFRGKVGDELDDGLPVGFDRSRGLVLRSEVLVRPLALLERPAQAAPEQDADPVLTAHAEAQGWRRMSLRA